MGPVLGLRQKSMGDGSQAEVNEGSVPRMDIARLALTLKFGMIIVSLFIALTLTLTLSLILILKLSVIDHRQA